MHQNKHQNKNKQHEPVLLAEVLRYLEPKSGESYLDLTAGYGGHARAVTERVGSLADVTLVDRDFDAVKILQQEFAGANIRQQDFLTASRELLDGKKQFELILADLGVSSPHLNKGERGFAINQSGPLDMRMDQGQALTADTIVNNYSEAELAGILHSYGEEPKADRIARLIVQARPLHRSDELARVVSRAWPGRYRIHPATRTFQALRIAVNDELNQLRQALPLWIKLLNPGGRLVVISFHSLEDRLVKQALADAAGDRYDAELKLLTKNPVTAAANETVNNPRARSAKLRAAAKINKKGN